MVAAPLLLSGDIGAGLGFLRRALPSTPPWRLRGASTSPQRGEFGRGVKATSFQAFT